MKAVDTAIYAKVTGDATLNGLVGGRIFKGDARQGAAYPYIVYKQIACSPEFNFSDNFEDCLYQFSIFSSDHDSTDEAETIYAALVALFDDCLMSITGYTHIWMTRTHTEGPFPEEHTTASGAARVWHIAIDYSIYLEESA